MIPNLELTKRNARVAGALYLGIIIFGVYSEFYVRSVLIDYQSARETFLNIQENAALWRSGALSDMICQLFHLMMVLYLYPLLKQVNAQAMRSMLVFVVISVGITFVNLLNHFAPIVLLEPTIELPTAVQENLLFFFVKMHGYGYTLAGIFFGLWLFPLGLLVKQSGAFPAIFGWLLTIGCFGYIIDTIVIFQGFSEYQWITYPGLFVALIAEFGFCFYLLIMGRNNHYHELAHS